MEPSVGAEVVALPPGTGSELPLPAEAAPQAKSLLREYLETIVLSVLFLLGVRAFVFTPAKIPTESMLDTLLIGDYILVDRFLFGAPGDLSIRWLGERPIARGDVIVFRFPDDPDTDFVKRVIGLPGETVEMREGVVYINDRATNERYLKPENNSPLQYYPRHTVPADSYFCLGDNRNRSRDSRYWGFVPRSLVKGRAFLIWMSYDEQRDDHLNTGLNRWWSIGRKLLHPGGVRFSRIFSLVR